MDIVSIVETSVSTLPPGAHSVGLTSVLRHIKSASKHLATGIETGDDDCFTDVIHRTNQAFEGSLKEAYRVLSGQNPEGEKIWEIEKYLQSQSILKPRVVEQLAHYRQKWRNPAAHEYSLEFDQSEAFLAVVSVSSFAKVLVDQISEELAKTSFKNQVVDFETKIKDTSLLNWLASKLVVLLDGVGQGRGLPNDVHALIGIIKAFFSLSDLFVATEVTVGGDRHHVDLLISNAREKVAIELKMSPHANFADGKAVNQVQDLVYRHADLNVILLLWHPTNRQYAVFDWPSDVALNGSMKLVMANEAG